MLRSGRSIPGGPSRACPAGPRPFTGRFLKPGSRYGGAITAAQFLAEFAGDTPWVHLDIAGTSMSEKEQTYLVKGATGVPVRTLVNLVLSLAAQQK